MKNFWATNRQFLYCLVEYLWLSSPALVSDKPLSSGIAIIGKRLRCTA
jgi:hypothetical protein